MKPYNTIYIHPKFGLCALESRGWCLSAALDHTDFKSNHRFYLICESSESWVNWRWSSRDLVICKTLSRNCITAWICTTIWACDTKSTFTGPCIWGFGRLTLLNFIFYARFCLQNHIYEYGLMHRSRNGSRTVTTDGILGFLEWGSLHVRTRYTRMIICNSAINIRCTHPMEKCIADVKRGLTFRHILDLRLCRTKTKARERHV